MGYHHERSNNRNGHWPGSSPNGPQYNRLNAVTAFDVNDVWAVGFTNGGSDQTLTEHWDGSSWSIVSSPSEGVLSELSGVGGIATDDLWAVGAFIEEVGFHPSRTLTEHWDGAAWSVVPSPNREGQLNAVGAVATDDVWAVGQISLRDSLFLHWDGQAWSIIDGPSDSGRQFAVAALAPDDVWSAGEGRRANNTGLFNHWDGTSWTTIPNPPLTPGFANIRGLSAIAPDDIWASGSLSDEFCQSQVEMSSSLPSRNVLFRRVGREPSAGASFSERRCPVELHAAYQGRSGGVRSVRARRVVGA